ncbi:hypothetical protein NPIL_604501 [Nephila pilipes]|uniref:Uncharacterized protein n=1 Tax=Nephila pilipes TaxID=299642 RepID=A0A8X6I6J6_NEPPI|nr:hypothetical protein NPIL_604501 [Nephila pilipes]
MHIPLPNNRMESRLQRAHNGHHPYLDIKSDEIPHHSASPSFKRIPPFPSVPSPVHLHDGGVLLKSIPPICYSLVKVNVTQVSEEDDSSFVFPS